MSIRPSSIDAALAASQQQLAAIRALGATAAAIARFSADAAALRFHLRDRGDRPPILVVLGGTGTGKSTIVNRLIGADVSAASYRRTFTSGPIAVVSSKQLLPDDWLNTPHAEVAQLPARGESDRLLVVNHDCDLTHHVTLVDTPDLDGDQPAHHAQADRAFRWAQAVLLLVTPEKYQMTELVPYFRLVHRYHVPALVAMNKTEQQAVVDDCRARVEGQPIVYAIPRDDSNYEPPPELNLDALRRQIESLPRVEPAKKEEGIRNRAADLLDRLHDQILAPLQADRRSIDRAIAMLKAMETPPAGIDVNPITRSLARRLQQRSIHYLIGPGKMLDRVRQVPSLLARLPRTAWDLVMRGKAGAGTGNDEPVIPRDVPDFAAILSEQLSVLHSRIDDVIRASPGGERWIEDDRAAYDAARFDTKRAGTIAEDELAQLKTWLETRWNATPRDTAILQKVLKHLPGGEKLTQWSEAAPYLLAVVVATHHAFFGHVDLLILGGYSLATWLTERMSNEVAGRTRQANKSIATRFEQLAHEQIESICAWLQTRAPTTKELETIRRTAEALGTGQA
jgi:hypothetical protein